MAKAPRRAARRVGRGIKASLWEIASGLLTTALLGFISRYRLLPEYVLVLAMALTIFLTIALITRMRSWGVLYTLGWLGGIWACYELKLLGGWDVVFYAVIPLVFIVLRLANRAQRVFG